MLMLYHFNHLFYPSGLLPVLAVAGYIDTGSQAASCTGYTGCTSCFLRSSLDRGKSALARGREVWQQLAEIGNIGLMHLPREILLGEAPVQAVRS